MKYNDPIEIVLGERFPLEQYLSFGDFSRAFFTASGFDVIISLTDLTKTEEMLIADEAFDVYIVDTDYGPFIVFQFGDGLAFEFTLNLMKMNQADIPMWLKTPDDVINLYVLEGTDNVVKAVRVVPFEGMTDLKVSCMRQLDKDKNSIDAFIRSVDSRYRITDLILNAQYHFRVPKVNTRL